MKKYLKLVVFVVLMIGIAGASYIVIKQEDLDTRDEAAGGQTITLITYNIMYSKQTKDRMTGIANFIKSKNADIVALQETAGFSSGTVSIKDGSLNYLVNKLDEIGYPMYKTQVEARTISVLSKTPILGYENFEIGGNDFRQTQTFYTDTNLGRIRIFNTHPDHEELLCEQIRNFIVVVNRYNDYDKFLLGDFNMTLSTECYNVVTGNFYEGCDPSLSVCKDTVNDTVHKRTANYAIDHIFYEKYSDWEVKSAYAAISDMGGNDTSDHYPVVAVFQKKTSECTPNCSGKQCGDNGCGGSCGSCSSTQTCNSSGMCIEKCTPNCSSKVCGSDGCGGSCGSCTGLDICISGQCQCVQSCSGKICGDDNGCGGRCTLCESGYTCNTITWQCESGICTPDCAGKQCGDDGCGGNCGDCDEGYICIGSSCQEIDYSCDINDDGYVNMLDMAIIQSNWGWEGDSLDQRADLNKDGKVNMLDMAAVINNWTKKY